MKSILIVTEIFDIGGLETHIRCEINSLNRLGWSVHLACGKEFKKTLVPQAVASLTSGLCMGPEATTEDLAKTVATLRSLIKLHKITVVHAHPFTSLIPSQIAAELEDVQFVVTLHGPVSLGGGYLGLLYDFLLPSVVLPNANPLLVVSEETKNLTEPYVMNDSIVVQPNAIDLNEFNQVSVTEKLDKKWIVVSRLDSLKIVGIFEFIKLAKVAGLEGVQIVGGGNAEMKLKEKIKREGLLGFVDFLGIRTDISQLMQNCEGVAGMGRVILEGVCSWKPTCLIGYDGVKGLVDLNLIKTASLFNYSGRNLPNISRNDFIEQINNVRIISLLENYTYIAQNFNGLVIWENFTSLIEEMKKVTEPSLVTAIFSYMQSNPQSKNSPYLFSSELYWQIGRLVHSPKYANEILSGNYSFYLERFIEKQNIQRDMKITSLNQLIFEKEQMIQQTSMQVAERDMQITSLNQLIFEKEQKISMQVAEYDVQIADYEAQITGLESDWNNLLLNLETKVDENKESIRNLNFELLAIKKSRGWKLLWSLWQIRLFFIPHGTRRERILIELWRAPNNFYKSSLRYVGGLVKQIRRKFSVRMSIYSFTFDVYKRKRINLFHSDLSSLHVPNQPNLVSIVLPVFNGANLIREALDSILNQSYTNFELIVINDGSQDNTSEILEEYARKDQRIRVVNQENQKLPKSLTHGFQLAKGEFLTWTSHDNRLKPDFLMKMIACLRKHPSWDMIYANMDIIGEDGTPLCDSTRFAGYQLPSGSEHIHLPPDTSELNTWPNNFIGGAFIYRDRVNWLVGDYSPRQYTREDYDYWMQINSTLTLKHVDFKEPIYDYRFHSDSLTHKDSELGITRDRKYLMVFDDFRRDFYQMPLIWFVDDDLISALAGEEKSTFYNELSRSEHILIKSSQLEYLVLPSLWIPLVYIKISSDPYSKISCPDRLPQNTAKVLLCFSEEQLPNTVDPDWDMCLVCGSQKFFPKLEKNRQGWWGSGDIRSLFTAIDIYVRSEHLRLIEQEIVQQQETKYKVSVIICTYKGGPVLEKALRSIGNQTLPQQGYEVLVIDNNPDGPTVVSLIDKIQAEEFSSCPENLRLIHCPILGLSYARNAGISEAKSEILFFLDDDATVSSDVLEQYWRAFSEHPDAGVIGGHILLTIPGKLAIPWKDGWERYWSHFVSFYSDYTTVNKWWEFPWGANWCARRKALLQIGGFRSRYGRRGNNFSGGEEIVAASLIQRLGYTVAVLPQAVVFHHVDPIRFTLNHLKQTIQAGIFVTYQAQIELHFPVESNPRNRSKQIIEILHRIIFLLFHPGVPSSRAGLLEAYFHLLARIKLFAQQFIDNFRRIRRPISSRD